MSYETTVELMKESMSFAAGHTTIFSATEREPLHGHTYYVYLALTTQVVENGMTFDYRYYKKKVHALCRSLNQTVLMPSRSPFLTVQEDALYYYFTFNGEEMRFLKQDVKLMPLSNITVEELSRWFVEALLSDKEMLKTHDIRAMTVKVFSAPGQSASHSWRRDGS